MSILFLIIIFSLIGSFGAMIGGVFMLWKDKRIGNISSYLVSFAGGVTLSVSLLDLFPEALELANNTEIVFYTATAAILFLFLIERLIWWYNHHRDDNTHHRDEIEKKLTTRTIYSILIGDGVHNFVDGIIIAIAFLTNPILGISVSIGVIAHEIPQEIADFSLMIRIGMKKSRVFIYNAFSALTTIVGAVLTYNFVDVLQGSMYIAISFAAGVFLYISLSNLMPEIHHQSEHKSNFIAHFTLFVLGIALIILT